MSVRLEFLSQNRAELLAAFTESDASEFDGGFRWQVTGAGDCLQADLAGRNDLIGAPPRAVARLFIDGTQVFHGVIADPPSVESPDAEDFVILGGREALRLTLMDGRVYRNAGVFQIARDVLARLCPPSLVYDPTQIGEGSGTDLGPTLSTFYAPTATLEEVMDDLARAAKSVAGVDQLGRPFLGRPARPALRVRRGDYPWSTLRTQGRETCTRAVLRVLSGVVLPERARITAPDYLPATVTQSAVHPLHALYWAEAGFDPPEGVSVVRATYGAIRVAQGVVDPGAAVDGNPDTAATLAIGSGAILTVVKPAGRVLGYRLRYSVPQWPRKADFEVASRLRHSLDTSFETEWSLPITEGVVTELVIMPPFAGSGETWDFEATVEVATQTPPLPGVSVSIYDLEFLEVDDAAAARLAESFLQVPYAAPLELQYDGLPAPTETLTVLDAPGGEVSGPVASYQFEHQPDGLRRALIRLGSTGQSDDARAIRWAVL